jgi:hypothetical protein
VDVDDDDDNLVGENINTKKKNTEALLVSRKNDLQVMEKLNTCSCLIKRMQEKITA